MRTLRVKPNPFVARDKDGIPCGVCPRDPDRDGGGPAQFVGARVSKTRTKVLQKFDEPRAELRDPLQRTVYEYMGIPGDDPELAAKLAVAEPIEIPDSKYYRDRIREGSLVLVPDAPPQEEQPVQAAHPQKPPQAAEKPPQAAEKPLLQTPDKPKNKSKDGDV